MGEGRDSSGHLKPDVGTDTSPGEGVEVQQEGKES